MTTENLFVEALKSLRKTGEVIDEQPLENIQGSYARAQKILSCIELAGLPAPNQAWVENSWTVLSWGEGEEGRALFIDNEPPHTVSPQFDDDGSNWLSCLHSAEDVEIMLSYVRRWVDNKSLQ